MIGRLNGRLIEKNPTDLLIECGGVGYEVKISLNTFSQLGSDEAVQVFTKLIVREDAHILYGFAEKSEREIFVMLLSVSGIGSNTARTMLSSLTPSQIKQAIVNENVNVIQSVKGIGLKTAQRVILDLKDKILKVADSENDIFVPSGNIQKEEALAALEVLGISRKLAEKTVDKFVSENPQATAENIIKQVLKSL